MSNWKTLYSKDRDAYEELVAICMKGRLHSTSSDEEDGLTWIRIKTGKGILDVDQRGYGSWHPTGAACAFSDIRSSVVPSFHLLPCTITWEGENVNWTKPLFDKFYSGYDDSAKAHFRRLATGPSTDTVDHVDQLGDLIRMISAVPVGMGIAALIALCVVLYDCAVR